LSEIRACCRCKEHFHVDTLTTRFCKNCKIKKNENFHSTICRYCKTPMEVKFLFKKYCSNKCRQDHYNIGKYIIKAEKQIVKQYNKIEFLRGKL